MSECMAKQSKHCSESEQKERKRCVGSLSSFPQRMSQSTSADSVAEAEAEGAAKRQRTGSVITQTEKILSSQTDAGKVVSALLMAHS